jgi:tetratricopeptide (TPR) repeat protein
MSQFAESLPYHDKSLEIRPDFDYALYAKGHSLSELGKHEEGLEFITQSLILNPNYDRAWFAKAEVLIHLNRLEEARDALNNALILNPAYDEAWIMRADVMLKMGKEAEAQFCYNEAMRTYDQALELEPANTDILLAKATLMISLGRSDEAIDMLKSMPNLESNARVSERLSVILLDQGRVDEAVAMANTAVKADPKSAEAWLARGNAFLENGKFEDSRHCYQVAEKLGAGVQAGQGLARSLIALKNFPEAMNALERASKSGRLSAFWRGLVLEEAGRVEDALELRLAAGVAVAGQDGHGLERQGVDRFPRFLGSPLDGRAQRSPEAVTVFHFAYLSSNSFDRRCSGTHHSSMFPRKR